MVYNVKSHELEIRMVRDGQTEQFPVRSLSDGEKGIISLVADIAYRMALLNPGLLDNILKTPGVVLIDEIDLHLHPAWQKKIVSDLTRIFPNIQFIMTTHSPSILVNVSNENILLLDHFHLYRPQTTTYGRTVDEVLQEVMDINVRPDKILALENSFDQAIDMENYELAKNILQQMRTILGDHAKRRRSTTIRRIACAVSSSWLTTPTGITICSLRNSRPAKGLRISFTFRGLTPIGPHWWLN